MSARASTVVWTADFEITSDDVDATFGMIAQFLDAGVEALRRHYA